MSINREPLLNEKAANVVENMAYRVAESHSGVITVNHLAPYLPMSLGLIRSCLDNMIDGHTVTTGEDDGFPTYVFAACSNHTGEEDLLAVTACVSCNSDLDTKWENPLCKDCLKAVEQELHRLAETTGWPAKAVYEHEILYLSAQQTGPFHAAQLAGHSGFTLKRMQRKLKAMTLDHFVRQEIDRNAATIMYHFPEIAYPKKLYRRNMSIIRSHPASVMEDMEIKVIRIILILAGMLFGVFVLAFLRIPLPLLIIAFLIAAPIVSFIVWRHKSKLQEE